MFYLLSELEDKCEHRGHLYGKFHFWGYYKGYKINKIYLRGELISTLEKKEEYKILAQEERVVEDVLEGELLKVKRLSDCFES